VDLNGRTTNFIAMGVGLIAIVGAVTTFNSKLSAMELATVEAMSVASSAKVIAEEEQKKSANRDLIMAQVLAQVGEIYKRGLVIPKGKAFVMDAPGDPYVELNISDTGASRLLEFKELKVTNMSHPDRPSAVIKVGPTFSNLTPDYVLQLSTEAGTLLHTSNGTWIQIRVDPVFENE